MASQHCEDDHRTTIRVTTQRIQDNDFKLLPNRMEFNLTNTLQNSTLRIFYKTLQPAPKLQRWHSRTDAFCLNPIGRASRLLHFLPLKQNDERFRSSPSQLQKNKVPEKDVDDFTKLGDKISELVEMMGGGKRSIHQAMRDLVSSTSSPPEPLIKAHRRSYKKLRDELDKPGGPRQFGLVDKLRQPLGLRVMTR